MTVEMHVPLPVMIVRMEMPPLTDQLHPEETAEQDQHESHEPFGGDRKRFRNWNAEDEHNGAHEEQNKGVADAPAETDESGGPPGRPLSEHRRDCGKMIGIQRMAQSQDKTESKNGQVGGISQGTPKPVRGRLAGLRPSSVESCAREGGARAVTRRARAFRDADLRANDRYQSVRLPVIRSAPAPSVLPRRDHAVIPNPHESTL